MEPTGAATPLEAGTPVEEIGDFMEVVGIVVAP